MSFKFFPILQTLERKAVFFERKKEAKKREFLLVSFSKCCSFRFRDYNCSDKRVAHLVKSSQLDYGLDLP